MTDSASEVSDSTHTLCSRCHVKAVSDVDAYGLYCDGCLLELGAIASGEAAFPFEPFGDRVVIRPDEGPDEIVHAHGITTFAEDKQVTTGIVVSLGSELSVSADGDYRFLLLGDRVVFSPYAGHALTLGKTTYVIMGSSEIMGRLAPEAEASVV